MKTLGILFISFLLLAGRATNHGEMITTIKSAKKASVKVGDCFTFQDSIVAYGLVLVQIETDGKHEGYAFAPIKLDTNKAKLEMFKHGNVSIGQYPDYRGTTTKGFTTFHFLNSKDLSAVLKLLY